MCVEVVGSSSNSHNTEAEYKKATTDRVRLAGTDDFPVHTVVRSLHATTLFAVYQERRSSSTERKRSHPTGTEDNDDNDDDDEEEEEDDDDRVRVSISDMNSRTFQKVVDYMYTVTTTPTLLEAAAAIAVLFAAPRCECAT